MEGIDRENLEERIASALAEDIGDGDVTVQSVTEYDEHSQAEIIAKQDGIVAGLEVAKMVFGHSGPPLDTVKKVEDGDRVSSGQQLMTIEGSGNTILRSERTALNLLGRMSGIATLTGQFVDAVQGTDTKILDTRKTTPLWRDLEKYAVRTGGGVNHRMGLYDMILIKENHIRWAGGLKKAVSNALNFRSANRSVNIEVEVQTLDELREIVDTGIERVLLDNMPVDEIKEAVNMAQGKVQLEVSGGVTLETVREYAETGVDFISVGALTHSAPAFDISLLFREENLPPGELAAK